jgi:hypothetical protein
MKLCLSVYIVLFRLYEYALPAISRNTTQLIASFREEFRGAVTRATWRKQRARHLRKCNEYEDFEVVSVVVEAVSSSSLTVAPAPKASYPPPFSTFPVACVLKSSIVAGSSGICPATHTILSMAVLA